MPGRLLHRPSETFGCGEHTAVVGGDGDLVRRVKDFVEVNRLNDIHAVLITAWSRLSAMKRGKVIAEHHKFLEGQIAKALQGVIDLDYLQDGLEVRDGSVGERDGRHRF